MRFAGSESNETFLVSAFSHGMLGAGVSCSVSPEVSAAISAGKSFGICDSKLLALRADCLRNFGFCVAELILDLVNVNKQNFEFDIGNQ